MKYLFIGLIFYAVIRLFVLHNLKRKLPFLILTLLSVFVGILGLFFDLSMADLIKGWIS